MNTTYLIAQLRESAPYMRDAGWHQTAALLMAAADQIEQLLTERSVLAPSTMQRESTEPRDDDARCMSIAGARRPAP